MKNNGFWLLFFLPSLTHLLAIIISLHIVSNSAPLCIDGAYWWQWTKTKGVSTVKKTVKFLWNQSTKLQVTQFDTKIKTDTRISLIPYQWLKSQLCYLWRALTLKWNVRQGVESQFWSRSPRDKASLIISYWLHKKRTKIHPLLFRFHTFSTETRIFSVILRSLKAIDKQ